MYSQPPLTIGGGAVGAGTIATAPGSSDPFTSAASSVASGHLGTALNQVSALPFTGVNILWWLVASFTLIACGLALVTLTGAPRRALGRRLRARTAM
jgi:hypothetical protein